MHVQNRIKKKVLSKDVFEREITLCRKLSKENGGTCGWGVCKNCGVLPLLIKLHKGMLLEDPRVIAEEKNTILS